MKDESRQWLVALAWVALMVAWVYGVFESSAYWSPWWLLPWALVHVVTGFLLGLRAAALALLLPPIGLPAGISANGESPAALILAIGYVVPAALLLALGGVFGLLQRRRAGR